MNWTRRRGSRSTSKGWRSIKRIGCFNGFPKQPERTVHVLYRNGCHYDAPAVDSEKIKTADAAAKTQAKKPMKIVDADAFVVVR